MITLQAESITPRLRYACELVFRYLLGLPYELYPVAAHTSASTIHYGIGRTEQHSFHIQASGLLSENRLGQTAIRSVEDETRIYFPSDPGFDLSYDIFSAVFYLATEYAFYQATVYDEHGRYLESDKVQHALEPLAHIYAERFWEQLCAFQPDLKGRRKVPQASFRLTYDIDHPWKYLHKSLAVQTGGFIKDLLSGNTKPRLQTLLGNKDPYQTFEEITALSPPDRTTFFFLIDRSSPHDGRHSYRSQPYRDLIRRLADQGYEIGIHPSYNAFLDQNRIAFETEQLALLIGKPIRASRMHFLKYRLPYTFRQLISCGISKDFTLCNYSTGGFRTGMALPYPWYDLEAERATDLMLYPTLLMDMSLEKYLKLRPAEAEVYAENLIRLTRQAGGCFTLLLHNDAFSETDRWKGWSNSWRKIIYSLQTISQT